MLQHSEFKCQMTTASAGLYKAAHHHKFKTVNIWAEMIYLVNLLLIYAECRLFMRQPTSGDLLTFCAVRVIGSVKMSQPVEVGVRHAAPLSFQQIVQSLVGPHKRWSKQAFGLLQSAFCRPPKYNLSLSHLKCLRWAGLKGYETTSFDSALK